MAAATSDSFWKKPKLNLWFSLQSQVNEAMSDVQSGQSQKIRILCSRKLVLNLIILLNLQQGPLPNYFRSFAITSQGFEPLTFGSFTIST